jgi:hypothetical protein
MADGGGAGTARGGDRSGGTSARAQQALRRVIGSGVLRSALVGLALGGLWAAAGPPVADSLCRPDASEGWNCLGTALLMRPAAALAGGVLGAVLLILLRVPQAARTAAAGFGACAALLFLDYSNRLLPLFGPRTDTALVLTGGYACAHAVVAERTRTRWRAVAAVLLLLPWPVATTVSGSHAYRTARLDARSAGVPLLAPDAPGYRLLFPHADPYAHTFSYLLLPASADADATDRDEHGVWVTVQPVPAAFDPPVDCDAEGSGGTVTMKPCRTVAPGVWLTARNGFRWYAVRPPGSSALAVFTAEGPRVPDRDLRAMAASLRPRDPGHFT